MNFFMKLCVTVNLLFHNLRLINLNLSLLWQMQTIKKIKINNKMLHFGQNKARKSRQQLTTKSKNEDFNKSVDTCLIKTKVKISWSLNYLSVPSTFWCGFIGDSLSVSDTCKSWHSKHVALALSFKFQGPDADGLDSARLGEYIYIYIYILIW